MRYRTKKRLKMVLLILIPLLAGILTYYGVSSLLEMPTGAAVKDVILPIEEGEVTLEDPLNVDGYTAITVEALAGGILLRDNCTGVYIAMSNLKSFSIKRGLEGTLDVRPNYHDLTFDLIDHYGGEVLLAKVSKLKNDWFYADLYIQAENDLLHLDSRPSDALGIAARFKAPMYLSDEIIEERGVNICNLVAT